MKHTRAQGVDGSFDATTRFAEQATTLDYPRLPSIPRKNGSYSTFRKEKKDGSTLTVNFEISLLFQRPEAGEKQGRRDLVSDYNDSSAGLFNLIR
jgi:hypothetical protein